MQKLAVKRVRDAYTRHDKWHLAAFLKEIGCAAKTVQEPVSKAEFERLKDNGLRALHPANQGQSCHIGSTGRLLVQDLCHSLLHSQYYMLPGCIQRPPEPALHCRLLHTCCHPAQRLYECTKCGIQIECA